jgi:hypothetical protein
MFTRLHLAIGFSSVICAFSVQGLAQEASPCDGIARDVTVAIEKNLNKTLLVVEDALVTNEGCAGDIVRAAILASKADVELVNQIVEAAINVAPKKAALIVDAANSVVPGAVVAAASVTSGEGDKNPVEVTSEKNPVEVTSEKNPVEVAVKNPVEVIDKNPVMPIEEEEEFVGASVRGIYLMQPPPIGFPPDKRKCDNVPTSPCGCAPKHMPPGKKYAGK